MPSLDNPVTCDPLHHNNGKILALRYCAVLMKQLVAFISFIISIVIVVILIVIAVIVSSLLCSIFLCFIVDLIPLVALQYINCKCECFWMLIISKCGLFTWIL